MLEMDRILRPGGRAFIRDTLARIQLFMARALGNAQNGMPIQFGLGSNQLTHYLAKMLRNQMFEVMYEIKVSNFLRVSWFSCPQKNPI